MRAGDASLAYRFDSCVEATCRWCCALRRTLEVLYVRCELHHGEAILAGLCAPSGCAMAVGTGVDGSRPGCTGDMDVARDGRVPEVRLCGVLAGWGGGDSG